MADYIDPKSVVNFVHNTTICANKNEEGKYKELVIRITINNKDGNVYTTFSVYSKPGPHTDKDDPSRYYSTVFLQKAIEKYNELHSNTHQYAESP